MTEQYNPLRTLNAAGQSVWYDNIERSMLTSGELKRLMDEDDLRGVTSNPSIFEKAINGSDVYAPALQAALKANPSSDARALFFDLAVDDIRDAADVMRPAYDKTGGIDGMVSLEVSPDLAHDTEATIAEALRLNKRLDRPNVMIKVPGTLAGVPAVEALIAAGVNINCTLLFSVDRYLEVAEAYMRGLEQRVARGEPIDQIASVASFFVSRVDAALDPLLEPKRPELCGKIAIANAKLAYRRFQELSAQPRYAALKAAGARAQRLLWASTSPKNPAYSDVLYIDGLIGTDTVNTIPPATYNAFRDHGTVANTLEAGTDEAIAQLAELPGLGINLTAITDRLETEGVASFSKSFDTLLDAIEKHRNIAASA